MITETPSYLIDFYDLITFYTNILLVTIVTAVNMNISLILITVIFSTNTSLGIVFWYVPFWIFSDIRYSIQLFSLVQTNSLSSLCAKYNSILGNCICFET